MVKRLSCLPSKQAARVRLPFGVLYPVYYIFWCLNDCPSIYKTVDKVVDRGVANARTCVGSGGA